MSAWRNQAKARKDDFDLNQTTKRYNEITCNWRNAGILMTRETSCCCQICLSISYCDSWNKEQFLCIMDNESSKTPDTNANNNEHTVSVNDNERLGNMNVEPSDSNSSLNDINVGTMIAAVYEKAWYLGKVDDKDDGRGRRLSNQLHGKG